MHQTALFLRDDIDAVCGEIGLRAHTGSVKILLRALAAPVFLQWRKISRCLAKGIAAVHELRIKSETMNWKGAGLCCH